MSRRKKFHRQYRPFGESNWLGSNSVAPSPKINPDNLVNTAALSVSEDFACYAFRRPEYWRAKDDRFPPNIRY